MEGIRQTTSYSQITPDNGQAQLESLHGRNPCSACSLLNPDRGILVSHTVSHTEQHGSLSPKPQHPSKRDGNAGEGRAWRNGPYCPRRRRCKEHEGFAVARPWHSAAGGERAQGGRAPRSPHRRHGRRRATTVPRRRRALHPPGLAPPRRPQAQALLPVAAFGPDTTCLRRCSRSWASIFHFCVCCEIILLYFILQFNFLIVSLWRSIFVVFLLFIIWLDWWHNSYQNLIVQ